MVVVGWGEIPLRSLKSTPVSKLLNISIDETCSP